MQIITHRFLWLSLLLAASTTLSAQSYRLDPAARLLIDAQTSQAPARIGQKEALTAVYVKYDADHTDWQAIDSLGGHIGLCAKGLATVNIPLSQLEALAQVKGISYVQAAQQAHPMLDLARAEAKADLAHDYSYVAEGTTEPRQFTGKGIVIGQVDAGLDYMHNAFKLPDGTLRIKRVWEQGTDAASAPIAGLHAPEPYGYGAEFDTPELILKAGGDSNAGSHGTHVMGIAAGSDTWLDGKFGGIAPEADLVMVAITDVGADNVRISDAIKYIFDYADSVDKPCVINLSLGSHNGPHDGTSPFDQIADALQGPGHLIVGASGNYGADHFHLSRTYAPSDDEPLQTLLNFKYSITSRTYGEIELWCDPTLPMKLELFCYSIFNKTESDGVTFDVPTELGQEVREFSLGRNISGKMRIVGEQNPLNGKYHVVLESHITSTRNNYAVGLRVSPKEGAEGQLDLWADDALLDFAHSAVEGFTNPIDESTITEIGGTAQRILSVGAYTTRDKFVLEGTNNELPVGMELNALSTFSGYGPTADGRQKPEICAPGSFIVSAVSGHDLSQLYMYDHYTDASGHPQRYGYMQGTSMSTPFVTGAVALWLEACPTLTPEQLKEVVAASARTDSFTGDTENRYWGHGKIDVMEGLLRSIELSKEAGIHRVEAIADGPNGVYDAEGHRLPGIAGPGLYIIHESGQARKVLVR